MALLVASCLMSEFDEIIVVIDKYYEPYATRMLT